MIFNILQLYWGDILLVTMVIFIILVMIKKKKYQELKGIGLSLIIQAEKALGSKTGSAKYSMALEALYSKLPNVLRFLFTQEELSEIIEGAVMELKGLLATGADLRGYDSEQFFTGGDSNDYF